MRDRTLVAIVWMSFVLIVGCGGYLMLTACDLGIRPIFGLNYCVARAAPDGFANERARERDLRDRIHEAELRVARLPTCLAAAPPPPPEPKRQAEAEKPPPSKPDVAPPEELTIPRQLSDLRGCWQSVRGDIEMVSDDAEQRPIGKVRICYCFADNGRGSTRYIYTDGGKCVGPLRARLSNAKLLIDHGRIQCSGPGDHGYVVPTEITCKSQAEGNSASCDSVSRGHMTTTTEDEKYQRVTAEHCS